MGRGWVSEEYEYDNGFSNSKILAKFLALKCLYSLADSLFEVLLALIENNRKHTKDHSVNSQFNTLNVDQIQYVPPSGARSKPCLRIYIPMVSD